MLKNNLADLEKKKIGMACDQVIAFLAIDSRLVVLNWGQICSPGDMWQYLETFLVVKIEGCY